MWESEEKILGVIGGMGPEATELFYEMIIRNTKATRDQEHLNMIILNHASMPDRTEAILSGNTKEVFDYLVADAKRLEQSGCAAIAIPCNTSHFFAEEIQSQISIPLINMVQEAARAAAKAGARKVGILATDGTVATGLYQKALEKEGLLWAIPTATAQQAVMSIIYKDVKAGEGMELSHILPVIEDLHAKGCDTFILGCTELSVFGKAFNLPAGEYIDAMNVLSLRCIEFCGKALKKQYMAIK